MANIDRKADYRIRNESGLETEVSGQVLIERALANEPDVVISGGGEVPLRQFVREKVDVKDTVREAHEQHGVDLGPLPDPKERAEQLAQIRQLEVEAAVGTASFNEEDDNLQDPAGDVLDNKDEDGDGIADRLQAPE